MEITRINRTRILLGSISLLAMTHAARAQVVGSPAVNAGEVSARSTATTATAATFGTQVLTRKAIKHEAQSVRTVTKAELNLFSPVASGVQAVSVKPGIFVSGYGSNAGTARSTIAVRGVKVGWNSVPGDIETNGITALFDGIPLNSLINGTGWHSTEVPIGQLLGGVNVIYGPGNPRDRWYDSIGGTINFLPVPLSDKPSVSLSGSYGSFDSQVYTSVAQTGLHDGWQGEIALAHAFNHTYRKGVYDWPARADDAYAKLRKNFEGGDISFGFYYEHNREYRPNQLPVAPVAGVTTAGLNANAPLYSQKTSGFYSDLPNNVWFKENQITMYLSYIKFNKEISDITSFHNEVWYRHGVDIHYRINYGFKGATSQDTEYYSQDSDTVGDQAYFDTKLPFNTISYGAYLINAHTHNDYDGYNTNLGTTRQTPASISRDVFNNLYVAGFLQDTITPIKGLHIVPGVQVVNYDTGYRNDAPKAALDLPSYTAPSTNPNVSNDFNRVEPSLGATYDITPVLTAYGNYAVTYQNPTGGNFNQQQLNLPALKPIKSTDYEIGIRAFKNDFLGLQSASADINYYRDNLEDETVGIADPNNPTVTTFGYGSGRLQGVNAELRASLDFHWMGFVNAGYTSAKFITYTSPSGAVYNNLPDPNTPQTTANIGVRYRTFAGASLVSANLWDQYAGTRYLFNNLTGAPTTRTYGAYNLVNLSVSVSTPYFNRFVPHLGLMKFSLYLSNLLGRKYNATEYISAGGYFNTPNGGYIIANPGAPRAVYGTVTVSF